MPRQPGLVRFPFRLPGWTLRARLATLLVLASLLPLLIGAYIDIRQTRTQLLDGMKQLLQARADQLVRELDSFHRAHQRSVDRLAHAPDTTAFCAGDPGQPAALRAAMLGLLATLPASDPAIGGAALLDRSGKVLIATNPAVMGADLAFRPHVRAALQGNAVISDIFLTVTEAGEQPSITYLMPVRDADQKLVGVALLLVRAKAFWDIVKTSNGLAGPGSFAVLFDPLGIRIAHTYSEDIVFHPGGALDAPTIDRLVAERRFGTRTRALLGDVRAFPEQFERSRASSPDLSVFRGFAPVNQSWNYGVARRFSTVPWTVFYTAPAANIESQIEQMTLQKRWPAASSCWLWAWASSWRPGSCGRFARSLLPRLRSPLATWAPAWTTAAAMSWGSSGTASTRWLSVSSSSRTSWSSACWSGQRSSPAPLNTCRSRSSSDGVPKTPSARASNCCRRSSTTRRQ